MFTLGVNWLSIVLHVFTYFILSSNIACEGHIIFLEMMYYLSQFWIMYFFGEVVFQERLITDLIQSYTLWVSSHSAHFLPSAVAPDVRQSEV